MKPRQVKFDLRLMEGRSQYHVSVMVDKVLAYLEPKPGGMYIELGVSTGGHLLKVCEMLGPLGFAVGVDLDGIALDTAGKRLKEALVECRVELIKGDYGQLPMLLAGLPVEPETFDACLIDAGISGFQLSGGRGFSYLSNEELDMRYDQEAKLSAGDILAHAGREELARMFTELGGLPEGQRVADLIVEERKKAPIRTTFDLVGAVSVIWPEKMPHGKRMRKLGQLFMALREAVNPGNESLASGVLHAARYLRLGGRLAVLTFSGDENVAVKGAVRSLRKCGESNPAWILKEITGGAVRPSRDEIISNPASHSAMLRVFEKRRGEGKEE